jgi:hypothetical protein
MLTLGEVYTRLLIRFQTTNCQRALISGILVDLTLQAPLEIKASVGHATPLLLYRLLSQDCSSSMERNRQIFRLSRQCSATSLTKAVQVDGHTITPTSLSMLIWFQSSVLHITQTPKENHADSIMAVHQWPRLPRPHTLVVAGVKCLRNR